MTASDKGELTEPPPVPVSRLRRFFAASAAGVGAIVGLCLSLMVPAFILLVIIKGSTWINENVYPAVRWFAVVAFGVSLVVCLPLCFFKKTRAVGASGIYIGSWVQGVSLWFWGYFAALFLAGTFGLIIGLLFMGVGVVPLAVLAAIFKGQWAIVGDGMLQVVAVFGSRAVGLYFLNRSANAATPA